MRQFTLAFGPGAGQGEREREGEEQVVGPFSERKERGNGSPRDTRRAGDGGQGGDEADEF